MSWSNFFDTPLFENQEWNVKEGFTTFIKNYFQQYLDYIAKSNLQAEEDFKEDYVRRIELFTRVIIDVINDYNLGKQLDAIKKINPLVDDWKSAIYQRTKDAFSPSIFFRARESTSIIMDQEEMFHIKNSERYKVSTQRFSTPGLPCLYLGNTVYGCWNELNRPSLEKFFVSAFKPELENFTILELRNTIEIIKCYARAEDKANNYGRIEKAKTNPVFKNYLNHWPLIFICLIKAKDGSIIRNFKEEYIIPQLIMQYISSSDKVHGIMYDVLSINSQNKDYRYFNLAVPVKTNDSEYCNILVDLFPYTTPISYNTILMSEPGFIFNSKGGESNNQYIHDRINLKLIPKKTVPYKNSIFGLIESYLEILPFQKLTYNK